MADPYTVDTLNFLVGLVFSLYILLIMLRTLFQLVRADFYNPLSQFIVKVTNPPLRPLRRIFPGFYGVDTAAVILMFALKFIELSLIAVLVSRSGSYVGLAVLSAAELLNLLVNVFLFAIIIQVILSWINPGVRNPAISLLYSLTEPLLRPVRRLIGTASGFDFSPIIVIAVLIICQKLIIARLFGAAGHLL